jgi:hypothetical protein
MGGTGMIERSLCAATFVLVSVIQISAVNTIRGIAAASVRLAGILPSSLGLWVICIRQTFDAAWQSPVQPEQLQLIRVLLLG